MPNGSFKKINLLFIGDNKMTRSLLTLDNRDMFKPFVNDFIGFERLFNQMNDVFNSTTNDTNNFPPYDIYTEDVVIEEDEKNHHSDNHTFIKFALAGISKDDIEVSFEDGLLTVQTKQIDWKEKNKEMEKTNRKYIRKGIAERQFCVQKTIADNLELVGAKWDNGCLIIEFFQKPKMKKESKFIEIQ